MQKYQEYRKKNLHKAVNDICPRCSENCKRPGCEKIENYLQNSYQESLKEYIDKKYFKEEK